MTGWYKRWSQMVHGPELPVIEVTRKQLLELLEGYGMTRAEALAQAKIAAAFESVVTVGKQRVKLKGKP